MLLYKIFYSFLFIGLLLPIFILIKVKKPKYFDQDPEFANSNRNPVINIHMEDHDSDPINFKRFDAERRSYSTKIQDLEKKYASEKKTLTDLIALQSGKIAQLSEIADSTNKVMEFLIKNVMTIPLK